MDNDESRMPSFIHNVNNNNNHSVSGIVVDESPLMGNFNKMMRRDNMMRRNSDMARINGNKGTGSGEANEDS